MATHRGITQRWAGGWCCNRLYRSGLAFFLLAAPMPGFAQSASTGAIAGIVRDTTGAVLPGVTVEAASPALIEKVRVVVSDNQGNYKIVDLRPGTYSVTFSLTGFSTLKREGIELTSGFTATVSADSPTTPRRTRDPSTRCSARRSITASTTSGIPSRT